ncbi:PH domain-containing protein [Thermodesulfobacteriota bacterium]
MDYKKLLADDEKVIFVTRLHLFVMIFPLVFTSVFGTIFILGGIMTGQFVEICYIMTAILGIYPIIVSTLIINTRYVITNKRVIEQTGVLAKRQRFIDLDDVIGTASYQTNLRKKLRCGDVRIEAKEKDKEKGTYFRVFRFIKKPHEFLAHLNKSE